jgi:hypothetical protein
MAFCNAVGKVSNWNAVGVPLADMVLLLWWTMHFVLWERDGTSHSCWQVCKICIVFGYGFQHIPFKWMHHTYPDIVWHLNIDSAPIHPAVVYPIFFPQKALISIWMPSLVPTCHWQNLTDLPPTHINSSCQHLISLPACPASKQELLSSSKKRGANCYVCGPTREVSVVFVTMQWGSQLHPPLKVPGVSPFLITYLLHNLYTII